MKHWTLFLMCFSFGCAEPESEPDPGATLPTGGIEDFTACGGDPTGTWQAIAISNSQGLKVEDACFETRYVRTNTGLAGTIRFENGQVDFDYNLRIQYFGWIPKTCFSDGESCESELDKFTQCTTRTLGCECIRTSFTEKIEKGSYDTSGQGELNSADNKSFKFCVNGDTLDIYRDITRFDGEELETVSRWIR